MGAWMALAATTHHLCAGASQRASAVSGLSRIRYQSNGVSDTGRGAGGRGGHDTSSISCLCCFLVGWRLYYLALRPFFLSVCFAACRGGGFTQTSLGLNSYIYIIVGRWV